MARQGTKILRSIVSAGERVSSGNRMTLSDQEVIREIKTIFLAGTDTTANTLTWAFYYVAKNPEILARCRKEALEAAPDTNGLVSTPEQFSRLVFCSAVFREALRMWPAGLIILVHSMDNYTMKNGMKTPAGTVFFLMNRYAAISEQAFTRAKEFIPERWIEAEREEALLGKGIGDEKRTVRHVEEAFMPFGGGPRACPGQDMAMYEATIMLAAASARFNMTLAPGQADPPVEDQIFSAGPRQLRLVLSRA